MSSESMITSSDGTSRLRKLTRRNLMKAGGALALSSPAGIAFAKTDPMAVPRDLDTSNPEHNLLTYMKIMSDLSGRTTYRYHSGRILAVPEPGQVGQPFMDFLACKQDRVRRLTDGSYQHLYKGVILFCELDTFRVLDTFKNPLTGKTVDVRHFRTSQGAGVFRPVGGAYSLVPSELGEMRAPGLSDVPFQLGWNIHNDDVWITYDERIEVLREDGTVFYADSSMYRYHASLAELQNPNVASAECTMSWQTETTWWPWMDMGDHPGHLIFGGLGRKYGDLSAVPPHVIEDSEKRIPGHLTSALNWSDFALPDPSLNPDI